MDPWEIISAVNSEAFCITFLKVKTLNENLMYKKKMHLNQISIYASASIIYTRIHYNKLHVINVRTSVEKRQSFFLTGCRAVFLTTSLVSKIPVVEFYLFFLGKKLRLMRCSER